MTTDKATDVTQDARAAAAGYHLENGFGPLQSRRVTADEIINGLQDGNSLVQAFASFEREILYRTASEQPASGEVDLRRIVKGWLDWYRFATRDDDNEYLNGKGWDDAEALAETSMGKLAALSTTSEAPEAGRLREALTDDPDNICAGVPDHAIDAGIDAWEAANRDMANYVSGETTDWDEGMIVAAIFKAVIRAALSPPCEGAGE